MRKRGSNTLSTSVLMTPFLVSFLFIIFSLDAFAAEKAKADDKQLVSKGKRLYERNCQRCHQIKGKGKPGTAPQIANDDFQSIASDEFLMATISKGRVPSGMPLFGYIGKDNIKAVIAYVRTLSDAPNRAAEVNAQPKTKGKASAGKKIYDRICAECHGPKGEGYEAKPEGKGKGTGIGRAGFLNVASDGFIRETIKNGRSNTEMKGFYGKKAETKLSLKEIDDVIAYLRTVPSKPK